MLKHFRPEPFYYIRNFTDMRCKHALILSVIREQMHHRGTKIKPRTVSYHLYADDCRPSLRGQFRINRFIRRFTDKHQQLGFMYIGYVGQNGN